MHVVANRTDTRSDRVSPDQIRETQDAAPLRNGLFGALPSRAQLDPTEIHRCVELVVQPGQLHEIRIPKTRRPNRRHLFGVVSGYFNQAEAATRALTGICGSDAEGVYISLNPVNPALLARAANRHRS